MSMSMKQGLAIIDRITKKAAVGHIHGAHVAAFLEEIEKAVEQEREACADIADAIGNSTNSDGAQAATEISREIRGRL